MAIRYDILKNLETNTSFSKFFLYKYSQIAFGMLPTKIKIEFILKKYIF